MASTLITTHELAGTRVLGGKNGTKRIGKVRRFVFHPKEKRCVGFVVKRPDLLWMFRRKDLFVSIDGYDMVDGRIVVRNSPDATGKGACKALGVDWDECLLWVGLPVMTEDGQAFGTIGNVTFNRITGAVDSFDTDTGATANTLLGKRTIPISLVKGFRRGMGAALAQSGHEAEETDDVVLGAMLVSDEVKQIEAEGGMAEKAGQATAVAMDKVQTQVDKAKPVVSEAARKTGEVVNKGAYVTGRQIAKSKTMFSDFKDEYDKARGTKPAKQDTQDADLAVQDAAGDEAPAPAAKKQPTKSAAAKKTAPKKNMFAAFKEEYNKARHDEE